MRNILLSKSFLFPSFSIAVIYVVVTVWLMNIRLVDFTVFSSSPMMGKFQILSSLLYGMFTSMSPLSIFLLIIAGLLAGANITLAIEKISLLKKMGKLQITIGGGLLLGILGSGCAACGLPIVALLGLSGGMLLLPFHGEELSFLSIALLVLSFIFLLKSVGQIACEIPQKKTAFSLTKKGKYENIDRDHGKSSTDRAISIQD